MQSTPNNHPINYTPGFVTRLLDWLVAYIFLKMGDHYAYVTYAVKIIPIQRR